MRGVRVVGVGPTLTAAIAPDAIVRVLPAATLYHVAGELHRLHVQGDAVVDVPVPSNSHEYRVGMALFSDEGDA
ncbi:hypothetical protein [Microbacterium sp. CFBP 8794]|uniref:hypothetical protein n=1 Tax=Microbacterium sp. CFBP 8794 TaxID=2775269 RepID=UPI00177D638E|nr:hypothetical protein [Microbacterium sp. CFBP 8794]MBD8479280.1 hypothetical protein [Microbacterium sp. CFBP 8794]